ncbi:hypothetical protein J7K56_01215 [Candidatus Calescamantes bacterium]|nr:hypothetical protein [Candidatus Calescamantes bacterium]
MNWIKEFGYFYIHTSELSPGNNEFLSANQFTVEYRYEKVMYRRPDLVIFINRLPLTMLESKNFNANERTKDAFIDHKTKLKDTPQLYALGTATLFKF